MSNNDDFDPRLYPELFSNGDSDLTPLELLMLMASLNSSQSDTEGQSENNQEVDNNSTSNINNDMSSTNDSLNINQNIDDNTFIEEMLNQQFLEETSVYPQVDFNKINDINEQNNINYESELTQFMEDNQPSIPSGRRLRSHNNLNSLMQLQNIFSGMQPVAVKQKTYEEIEAERIKIEEQQILENKRRISELETKKKEEEIINNKKKEEDIIINPHLKHRENRCNLKECRKKVGLLGFECKCGYKFCSKHRYEDTHNCSYDHVSDDIQKLIKSNPAIIRDKLNRI